MVADMEALFIPDDLTFKNLQISNLDIRMNEASRK